ncbi:UPF0014-domain-containing protein [Gloeophyllum trabeum ATCC 11539]|uniref:UPF0014-domain-containing protein n=1 Tax=Gloeophyllum trabeum (strain ATCC 11539 / FP-39264 / Madison 617) TaxID=670483 RepID=S7RE74_GLOTA|nr:UPF0014-domain-containing protein [Gloeophyllum trabeum ATCC 11539]EPQ52485.1 UPF0014-domain-containing protein [Gloeophyllum trabeum ATCC 11539]
MDGGNNDKTHLTFQNVGLAFSFIVFDALVSHLLRLGVGTSLVTAATRCIIQLSVMALVLAQIFETGNPWGIAGIAGLLNLMGTLETVINKAKMRFQYMFPSVLLAMVGSTIPVSIIGTRFAMAIRPFWIADQYIPIVGMLCGSTISGMVIAVNYVLKELHENRDKVEVYLAFGATRFEACKPIATDALRLALTPNVNQMSVLGIISIPGMMTGAILGGSSVQQAARLQMVIMFMISSCTALSSMFITVCALGVVVDGEHRIRGDRIDTRPHAVYRARGRLVEGAKSGVNGVVGRVKGLVGGKGGEEREEGERERLLG